MYKNTIYDLKIFLAKIAHEKIFFGNKKSLCRCRRSWE